MFMQHKIPRARARVVCAMDVNNLRDQRRASLNMYVSEKVANNTASSRDNTTTQVDADARQEGVRRRDARRDSAHRRSFGDKLIKGRQITVRSSTTKGIYEFPSALLCILNLICLTRGRGTAGSREMKASRAPGIRNQQRGGMPSRRWRCLTRT